MIDWTPESLSELLVSNGRGTRMAHTTWPFFEEAAPLPQSGRPGEPTHPSTPCLVWRGQITARGYGRLNTRRGETRAVHIIALILASGSPSEGMQAGHLCERRSCARPDQSVSRVRWTSVYWRWLCRTCAATYSRAARGRAKYGWAGPMPHSGSYVERMTSSELAACWEWLAENSTDGFSNRSTPKAEAATAHPRAYTRTRVPSQRSGPETGRMENSMPSPSERAAGGGES